MIVEHEDRDFCPAEFDLELNLTTTGSVVTGTSKTLLRRVEAQGPCNDVLGGVHTYDSVSYTHLTLPTILRV